jgi:uncharacterized membrane protein YqjE
VSDGENNPEGGSPASEPKASEPKPADGAASEPKPADGAASEPKPAEGAATNGTEDMSVGELVFEISDRASVLVREEIELAKAEVTEKFNRLVRGSVVGLVAGVFVLLALAMVMHGIAWLINDLFFDNFWAGFLIEAGFFLLVAAGAGFYAYRAFKKGAPPTPDMAIEEAKEIAAALDGEGTKEGSK